MSLSPKTDKVAINDEGMVICMGASFTVNSSTGYWVFCDYSGDTYYTSSNMMQASDDLLPEPHLLVSRDEFDAMLDEILTV